MRWHNVFAAAAVAALYSAPYQAFADGNAENGSKIFNTCKACHKVGDGAANGVGPALTGVVGRKAGSFAGFSYSPVLKAAGDEGLTWADDSLKDYLADPSVFLKKYLTDKGKADQATSNAKMPFKLPDETARLDVIAYLKTFSKWDSCRGRRSFVGLSAAAEWQRQG